MKYECINLWQFSLSNYCNCNESHSKDYIKFKIKMKGLMIVIKSAVNLIKNKL